MRKEEKKQMVGDLLRRDQFAQSFNLPLSEALARDIGPADCQPPLHLRKTSKKPPKSLPKKVQIQHRKPRKISFYIAQKCILLADLVLPATTLDVW